MRRVSLSPKAIHSPPRVVAQAHAHPWGQPADSRGRSGPGGQPWEQPGAQVTGGGGSRGGRGRGTERPGTGILGPSRRPDTCGGGGKGGRGRGRAPRLPRGSGSRPAQGEPGGQRRSTLTGRGGPARAPASLRAGTAARRRGALAQAPHLPCPCCVWGRDHRLQETDAPLQTPRTHRGLHCSSQWGSKKTERRRARLGPRRDGQEPPRFCPPLPQPSPPPRPSSSPSPPSLCLLCSFLLPPSASPLLPVLLPSDPRLCSQFPFLRSFGSSGPRSASVPLGSNSQDREPAESLAVRGRSGWHAHSRPQRSAWARGGASRRAAGRAQGTPPLPVLLGRTARPPRKWDLLCWVSPRVVPAEGSDPPDVWCLLRVRQLHCTHQIPRFLTRFLSEFSVCMLKTMLGVSSILKMHSYFGLSCHFCSCQGLPGSIQ